MDIEKYKQLSKSSKKENTSFFKFLKAKKIKNIDALFHKAHNEAFEKIDCLTCANCCKTTSPIFKDKDIARISIALKLKPGQFTEKYLKIDEDNDYVLKESPCAFLNADNTCSVYNDRPNACREYPHTNRKNINQILNLTYHNTLVCPAVFEIVKQVKKELNY
ncbi:MAG: YkgJ family cysteine cluster protein [Bacteroidetes bacterium]|nr:YkgJ family cysteine cluster protein [Bacteroidota bacterium]